MGLEKSSKSNDQLYNEFLKSLNYKKWNDHTGPIFRNQNLYNLFAANALVMNKPGKICINKIVKLQ